MAAGRAARRPFLNATKHQQNKQLIDILRIFDQSPLFMPRIVYDKNNWKPEQLMGRFRATMALGYQSMNSP